MIGARPSSRNPKEAVVVTVLEQLPCRPREVSSKEECRSCALWEPRTVQRTWLVSQPSKSPVPELLPRGLQGPQPAGVLKMTQTAAGPHSQSCPGRRDPRYRTSLGPVPPAVPG